MAIPDLHPPNVRQIISCDALFGDRSIEHFPLTKSSEKYGLPKEKAECGLELFEELVISILVR